MKMLKITAAVAFALAMAGCGDSGSKDASASGAANTSGNAAANVAAKPAKTYSPKVLADTEVAVQYRKNTSAALQPLVDALENVFKKALSKESFSLPPSSLQRCLQSRSAFLHCLFFQISLFDVQLNQLICHLKQNFRAKSGFILPAVYLV